ncbi:MAG: MFS transporter [Firmicutes bacterium]|nr:MFS transporter [Bacillota bacterium]
MLSAQSPYRGWPGKPRLGLADQLALGFFWFPSNVLWTGLLLIVLPARVLQLVGARQATGVLSWTSVVGVLVAIVVTPLAGILSDRWRSPRGRRRPQMALGVLASLPFLAAVALAGSVGLFLLGLVGIQLFNNVGQAAYQGLIPDLVAPEQRGEASGFMAFYNQAGVIVGGLLAAFLPAPGFTGAVALLLLAGVGVTWAFVREPPSLEEPRRPWVEELKGFLRWGETYRDFWWVFATRFLVMIGLYVLEQYLFYYLKFVLGVATPDRTVFLLLLVLSATALVASLGAGYLSDRLRRRRFLVAVAGILQGACALLFVFSHSLGLIYAAAAVFGLGYGAYQSVDWALVVDTLPGGTPARDMGIWGASTTGPQLVALLAGGLLGHFVAPAVGLATAYRLLFAVTALFFAAGSGLVWQVRSVA